MVFGRLCGRTDRKSTRLNSSHTVISYAVFCLKKKITTPPVRRNTLQGMNLKSGVLVLCWVIGALCQPAPLRPPAVPLVAHVPYFFFNDTAAPEIYTLSLHDALPI